MKNENMRKTSLRSWNNNNYKNNKYSAANDYAPSCLDCHAHSMLVSTTNQKRAATSSSLKIEEAEERPVLPTRMVAKRGSNPGPVASKSGT